MELDQAIEHAIRQSCEITDTACSLEHLQLANWLIELQKYRRSTLQYWVHELPRMQQAVILGAIRGPDGVLKESPVKHIVRWYRRSTMVTAFDGKAILDMHAPGGGNYTGPVPEGIDPVKSFLSILDALPWHFISHFIWGAEIVGHKHPEPSVRAFWHTFYTTVCNKLHINPETLEQLEFRLGDNEKQWRSTEGP